MPRIKSYTLLLFLLPFLGLAQVNTIDQNLIWMGAELRANWRQDQYINLKVEERRFAFPDGRQQRVLPDLRYGRRFRDNWTVEAGLWFFEINQPQDPRVASTGQIKEFRPYFNVVKKWGLSPAQLWSLQVKSEYRLFRSVEAANHLKGPILREDIRERLKLAYSWQIAPGHQISFYDELHLTVYSTRPYQWFQQNRLGTTYRYQVLSNLGVKVGYLFWFQPTGAPAQYFARQIFTFSIGYSFEL